MLQKEGKYRKAIKQNNNRSKYYQFIFEKDIKINQILDLFQSVSKQLNFCMLESESNHAVAIKEQQKNLLQVLDCYKLFTNSNSSVVKMVILKKQFKNQIKCRIYRLLGSDKQVFNFCKKFNQRRKQLIKVNDSLFLDQDVQLIQPKINPYYLEYSSIYTYTKIMSDRNNQVGKFISKFIRNFQQNFQDELIQNNMKKIIKVIDKIVQVLNKKYIYEYSQKDLKMLIPYCKGCVQKYIFQKTSYLFEKKYMQKNEDNIQFFKQIKERALQCEKVESILQNIGLRKHLWFIDQKNPQQWCLQKMIKIRFKKCVKEIEKIDFMNSPRQNIYHCQLMFTYLKIIIYEKSQHKYELNNIQDIIPLLILVLICTETYKIKLLIDMMIDFINNSKDFDEQKRLIMNLLQSYNSIVQDLKLNDIK